MSPGDVSLLCLREDINLEGFLEVFEGNFGLVGSVGKEGKGLYLL